MYYLISHCHATQPPLGSGPIDKVSIIFYRQTREKLAVRGQQRKSSSVENDMTNSVASKAQTHAPQSLTSPSPYPSPHSPLILLNKNTLSRRLVDAPSLPHVVGGAHLAQADDRHHGDGQGQGKGGPEGGLVALKQGPGALLVVEARVLSDTVGDDADGG